MSPLIPTLCCVVVRLVLHNLSLRRIALLEGDLMIGRAFVSVEEELTSLEIGGDGVKKSCDHSDDI